MKIVAAVLTALLASFAGADPAKAGSYTIGPDVAVGCKAPITFESYSPIGKGNLTLVDLGDGLVTVKLLADRMVYAVCGLILIRTPGMDKDVTVTGDRDFPSRIGSQIEVTEAQRGNGRVALTTTTVYRVARAEPSANPRLPGELHLVEVAQKGASPSYVNYWSRQFNWFVGADPRAASIKGTPVRDPNKALAGARRNLRQYDAAIGIPAPDANGSGGAGVKVATAGATPALPSTPTPARAAPPEGTASTWKNPLAKSYKAGETFQDCPECPRMAVLPAGSFMMGSPADEPGRKPSEGPRHRVTFARPFAIGTYELTFDEYDACVAATACRKVEDFGWGRGKRPAVAMTYSDAVAYVGWLSEKTGKAYFIPSESEWEYAARAGSETPWNTGDGITTDDANILGAFEKTTPVGGYAPNAFGLYDVHGNVAEWVQDCYDTGYVGVPTDGSAATGATCDQQRIIRGGADNKEPVDVRSAARQFWKSSVPARNLGFRVARALE